MESVQTRSPDKSGAVARGAVAVKIKPHLPEGHHSRVDRVPLNEIKPFQIKPGGIVRVDAQSCVDSRALPGDRERAPVFTRTDSDGHDCRDPVRSTGNAG